MHPIKLCRWKGKPLLSSTNQSVCDGVLTNVILTWTKNFHKQSPSILDLSLVCTNEFELQWKKQWISMNGAHNEKPNTCKESWFWPRPINFQGTYYSRLIADRGHTNSPYVRPKTRSTLVWCLKKNGRRWFMYNCFAPWMEIGRLHIFDRSKQLIKTQVVPHGLDLIKLST